MIDIDHLQDVPGARIRRERVLTLSPAARAYLDHARRVDLVQALEAAHIVRAREAQWDRCPPGALAPVPCRPLPWWRRMLDAMKDAT